MKGGWSGAIVTAPNCSTSIMVLPIKPVFDEYGIEKIHNTTMQAISGGDYPGVSSMDMIDNVVPYIGGEEEKLVLESKKILGEINNPANYELEAFCNRVNILDGHLESIFIKTKKVADLENIKTLLKPSSGLIYIVVQENLLL